MKLKINVVEVIFIPTKLNSMITEDDKVYLPIIDSIEQKVYKLYRAGGRKDLVMVYNTTEKRIYSYVYKDYLVSLHPKSQRILQKQYVDAKRRQNCSIYY